ncbi:hypothetical protein BV25DRAFT_1512741 [Artomyces pyxidatus]|uniref:Uncharacterized protein n=1 Tax=Artomyces pyxidatus TaxID=48021 RepID=A0ACB8TD64_9AGAM|nr:hypothetical protein BV25DRAFT_1512741 [Artomyces pyxidatus]
MLFLGFACVALLHLPIAHAVDNHNSTDSCKQELAPSPCYVAKGLVAPCKENLEDGFEGGNSVCTCNTVLYNLVSACKLCYNGTESLLPAFDAWAVNCTPPNLVQMMNYYPLPEVSKSVHIPKWAYADLTADNSFDITAALRRASFFALCPILELIAPSSLLVV